jgi:hypothetical protein
MLFRGTGSNVITVTHAGSELVAETFYLFTFKFDNTNTYVYHNGTLVGQATDANTFYLWSQIGYRFNTDPFNGDIAEIREYNYAMIDADREAIESTLLEKYGFTSSGDSQRFPQYPDFTRFKRH